MRLTIIRCFLLCALCGFMMCAMEANPVLVAVSAGAPNGVGFDQNPIQCGSISGEVFVTLITATTSCAGTSTIKVGPFAGLTFDAGGSASASVNGDTLKADAVISASNAPHDSTFHSGSAGASAEARTNNAFSVSNMTGMTMVQFKFEESGSMGGTPGSFAGGRLEFDPLFFPIQDFILSAGSNDILTQALPMDLSKPFSYVLDLFVEADVCAACNSQSPVTLYSGSAQVDFSHTVKLIGMTITDMNGNPLTGLTITSQDGVDYNALLNAGTSAAAPEPATFATVGFALLAAGFRIRRRIRKNSPNKTDAGTPAVP